MCFEEKYRSALLSSAGCESCGLMFKRALAALRRQPQYFSKTDFKTDFKTGAEDFEKFSRFVNEKTYFDVGFRI